jgi:hypothetical protein
MRQRRTEGPTFPKRTTQYSSGGGAYVFFGLYEDAGATRHGGNIAAGRISNIKLPPLAHGGPRGCFAARTHRSVAIFPPVFASAPRIDRATSVSATGRGSTTRKVMRTLPPGASSSCAIASRASSSGSGLRAVCFGGPDLGILGRVARTPALRPVAAGAHSLPTSKDRLLAHRAARAYQRWRGRRTYAFWVVWWAGGEADMAGYRLRASGKRSVVRGAGAPQAAHRPRFGRAVRNAGPRRR